MSRTTARVGCIVQRRRRCRNATSRPEWLIEMEKPMSTWRSVQNLISRELVEHVMPRKGEKNLRHIEQKRVRKGKVANWSPPGERRNGCTYAHKIGRGRGGRCPESKRAAKGGGEVDARARGASGESKKPQAKTTDPKKAPCRHRARARTRSRRVKVGRPAHCRD